jgi:hypothetical protein
MLKALKTLIWNFLITELPASSVTFTVKILLPAFSGVPEMMPSSSMPWKVLGGH